MCQISRNSPCRYQITGQTKAIIITAIDVFYQFVHFRMITACRQLNGLLERIAAGQQTAQTQEHATTQTRTRYSFVIVRSANGQNGYTRANVHQNEWIRLGKVVFLFLAGPTQCKES